jgi:hypothetical protein
MLDDREPDPQGFVTWDLPKQGVPTGVPGAPAPADVPCKAHHLIACVQCADGVSEGRK